MSDEEEFTQKEIDELEMIAKVYARGLDLCHYIVSKMDNGEMGIACEDDGVAIELFERIKEILEIHSGNHGSIKFEYTSSNLEGYDDGSSGGSETDLGEESRELRPSNRKLH